MIPSSFTVTYSGETAKIEIPSIEFHPEDLTVQWVIELPAKRIEISLRQLDVVRSQILGWIFAVQKAIPQREFHIIDVPPPSVEAMRLIGLDRFVTVHTRRSGRSGSGDTTAIKAPH